MGALEVLRALGDRVDEAAMLGNVGTVYNDLGDKQNALDYDNQALLMDRAVGDRAREATILSNLGNIYGALGKSRRRWSTTTRRSQSSGRWVIATPRPPRWTTSAWNMTKSVSWKRRWVFTSRPCRWPPK